MATTKIDVPAGVWTQIMPVSDSAYCVVDATFGVKFKQSATAPSFADPNCSVAYFGDLITGSAALPIWARPAGNEPGKVTRHD